MTLLLLSATPILLILFLMLGLRWGAVRAGGLGYLAALLIARLWFGAGGTLLAYAHSRALILSLDVLLIIWAAFLFYRVTAEAGAVQLIGQALPRLTGDRGLQALIIGWVFASFLQSVGGFGVPVAVTAPMLIQLGFTPLAAVIIPSVGHGWAVTFGSMGSAFQSLLATTGQPEQALAGPSALFLGLACILSGWLCAYAASGWAGLRRLFLPALWLGVLMGTAQYLVARTPLWNVASLAGGLAGLLGCIPLVWGSPGVHTIERRPLLVALSGYAVLVALTLAVQFIGPLNHLLSALVIQIPFPETRSALGYIVPASSGRRIVLLRHAGMILAYVSILSYLIYERTGCVKPGAWKRILSDSFERVLPSAVNILSMVSIAVIMEHAGMTDQLAKGLAGGTGPAFPLLTPWIGALGAFVTGSNTNANVMFGALQLLTAQLLGYSSAFILAGQTAGAGIASVIAPAKMVVGASTTGQSGHEGQIMRHMIGYTLTLLALISLLTWLGAHWGG